MVIKPLKTSTRRGERAVEGLLGRTRRVVDRKTRRAAEKIVSDVRRKGDRGLLRAVADLDGVMVESVADLRLAPASAADLAERIPPVVRDAIETAITAIDRFHAKQVRRGYELVADGIELEERITPLRRVGIYVPGGRFPYPSTVLMTVIPAQLAGVEEIVVATPPQAYEDHALLRYVLARLQINEIWGMGGAQAIAALAYGTETIRRVDKVVGPGSAWVSAAKMAVAGDVAVDGLPGPSEVLVLASTGADPALVAADLLAQAEHDPLATAVLVTPDGRLADRVAKELAAQLEELPEGNVAGEALAGNGAILVCDDLEEAAELVERIAPEHLQLLGEEAEALAPLLHTAGAIFVGAASPVVFGDYLAGPSHVLPTGGSARFASALGVDDFLRRSHTVRFDDSAAAAAAEAAASFAEAEGLAAHAASARRRSK